MIGSGSRSGCREEVVRVMMVEEGEHDVVVEPYEAGLWGLWSNVRSMRVTNRQWYTYTNTGMAWPRYFRHTERIEVRLVRHRDPLLSKVTAASVFGMFGGAAFLGPAAGLFALGFGLVAGARNEAGVLFVDVVYRPYTGLGAERVIIRDTSEHVRTMLRGVDRRTGGPGAIGGVDR
jgi:hypothetical protein